MHNIFLNTCTKTEKNWRYRDHISTFISPYNSYTNVEMIGKKIYQFGETINITLTYRTYLLLYRTPI